MKTLRSPVWSEFAQPPSGEPAYSAWANRFNAASHEATAMCQRQEAATTICELMESGQPLCGLYLDALAQEVMVGAVQQSGAPPRQAETPSSAATYMVDLSLAAASMNAKVELEPGSFSTGAPYLKLTMPNALPEVAASVANTLCEKVKKRPLDVKIYLINGTLAAQCPGN